MLYVYRRPHDYRRHPLHTRWRSTLPLVISAHQISSIMTRTELVESEMGRTHQVQSKMTRTELVESRINR